MQHGKYGNYFFGIIMLQLNKDKIKEFKKKGYTVIDKIFTTKEMNTLSLSVKNILKYRFKSLKNNNEQFNSINSKIDVLKYLPQLISKNDRNAFDHILDTIYQTPEFMRMVSKEKIQNIANKLMNNNKDSPLYGYINKCRINLPQDEIATLGWHREIFQTIPRSNFIQIWAPLFFNSTSKNGALQFCEGSHLVNFPKPKWTSNKNGTSKIVFNDENTHNFKKIEMNLKVGQAVFFSGKLLHRSGNNISNLPRFSMVGLYHNIEDDNFIPPKAKFDYQGESPKDYFDSLSYY